MVANKYSAPTPSCAMARPLPKATRRANNLLAIRARPADETARGARGSGQNGTAPSSASKCRFGYRNLNGRWFKSHRSNQHCESKKISVRKTQKPQRFLGFFVPFFKVLFKRYHFPKTPIGKDLNRLDCSLSSFFRCSQSYNDNLLMFFGLNTGGSIPLPIGPRCHSRVLSEDATEICRFGKTAPNGYV